jgi:iron complex outermembrane receptor protein
MKLDRSVLFCGSAIAAIAMASPAFAQAQGSGSPAQASERATEGTITGVVATEAGGNILRNAVITIDAGDKHYSEVSGEDGSYTVQNVPAGPVTVTVSFVGYVAQTQEAAIAPGGTARLDFHLAQSGRHGEAASESDIVVQGEREGQASSIQAQRREMQIADVISTEAYGDIAGGNPAEMIKYMPGVDVDGTNGTSIYAFLRGLPGEYTRTQLNGMDVVSANANSPTGYANSAAAARIFSYESISMSAIDSVTVLYKTVSADQQRRRARRHHRSAHQARL